MNLAKEISAPPTLIGTDIEPLLFPEPSSLPPHLLFQIQSVSGLPSMWTGRFTVVNQRLLVASLRAHEWPRAIGELYQVTKPGSWIEILELDVWSSTPIKGRCGVVLVRSRMTTWLEGGGFTNVYRISRATVCGIWAGQHGIGGKENLMGMARGLKTPVSKRGCYGVVNNKDHLIEQIGMEYDVTLGSQIVWSKFVAQKSVA